MHRIDNIVFDLGRVLINWDPYSYMIEKFKTEVADFLKKAVFDTDDWDLMDKGELTEEELWEKKLIKYPEYREYILHMKEKVVELLTPIEKNVKLIPVLKHKGFKLYILSNFSKVTFDKVYKKYDFFKYFDGMIISSHVGEIKPDEKIYKILIEKYNINPEISLYIDDKIENILTGQKVGFKTIHLEKPELLKAKLRAYINF
ncbi:HAD family hydrolase [Thermosipho atlanticus]|uniref:Putative hydrolase of the HAD superfamily n=1 Tax=Thermosipho atlanticus DSM 15807 TaxID=1123380 RepID=A0A1M5RRU6_9BACT|nr:HAD family phosphatase [Thermosipho atlanticus]SHH29032.1 putative hydrolase of the HAD superfamily [Thermosipho atlanticus DSM 15807]